MSNHSELVRKFSLLGIEIPSSEESTDIAAKLTSIHVSLMILASKTDTIKGWLKKGDDTKITADEVEDLKNLLEYLVKNDNLDKGITIISACLEAGANFDKVNRTLREGKEECEASPDSGSDDEEEEEDKDSDAESDASEEEEDDDDDDDADSDAASEASEASEVSDDEDPYFMITKEGDKYVYKGETDELTLDKHSLLVVDFAEKFFPTSIKLVNLSNDKILKYLNSVIEKATTKKNCVFADTIKCSYAVLGRTLIVDFEKNEGDEEEDDE